MTVNNEMSVREQNLNNKSSSTNNQKFLMSAALITDSKDGLLLLPLSSDFINVKIYFLYRHWILQYILYSAIFLHHFIILFEKNDSLLDKWKSLTTSLEFLCLLIYTIRLSHLLLLLPSSVFWCDKKNVLVATTIFVTICDILLSFVITGYVRWSPVLRPLFIINFAENKQVINYCLKFLKLYYLNKYINMNQFESIYYFIFFNR
jgi:hypothetical protein